MSIADEDTLGVIRGSGQVVGRESAEVVETFELSTPLLRALTLFCAAGLAARLVQFMLGFSQGNTAVTAVAWLITLAVLVIIVVTAWSGQRLSRPATVVTLAALAAAVVIDLLACWETLDPNVNLTAGRAAVFLLAAFAMLTRPRVAVIAAVVASALFAAVPLLHGDTDIDAVAGVAVSITGALVPVVFVTTLLGAFSDLARVVLDRERSERSLGDSPVTLGMRASARLARLDLDAEHLLAAVGDGSEHLPLRPERSGLAAQLATELRQHLLTSRRDTWLVAAISESAILGRRVALDDELSTAARLTTEHRRTLLSTVWLIAQHPGQHLEITFGASHPGLDGLPLTLEATAPIRRFDSIAVGLADVGRIDFASRSKIVLTLTPEQSFAEVQQGL